MQISLNNTLYPGLSAIQVGQNRVDQAATQLASPATEVSGRTQSSDYQLERLRAVERPPASDMATNIVELTQGKIQVQAGVKVEKASDEMLGTLIDTYA